MRSLTRLTPPPLRPALPRPRRPHAGALRPPPLVPHVALRRRLPAPEPAEPRPALPQRLPAPAHRLVERPARGVRAAPVPADPGARRGPDRATPPAVSRTTTEQMPAARAPVARPAPEAAAPAAPMPPGARTRTTIERVLQPAPRAVVQREVPVEVCALRPAPARPPAPSAALVAPPLRPAAAPRSSGADDAPLRPAP